jgi:CheY-like chemotaxis protein
LPTALGLHVLAVDDNSTNQLVIKRMLQKLGCTFTVVGNGQLAVEAITGPEKFDIVLLDQFMPVLDGPGAARAIRGLPGDISQVPIIAMTASNLQEDEQNCLAAGMDSFLCKPVSLRKLADVLVEWVGKRRQDARGT